MNVLLAGISFVLGSAFGSFLNLVVDRVPARQSIVRPGSRCPACETPLRPADLVPVVSYLWLRGRCRYCAAPIPARLMIVELVAGLAFVGVYLGTGINPGLIAAACLAFVLAGVAAVGVLRRRATKRR